MTDKQSSPTYADQAWQGVTTIVENVQLARDTYRVRLRCPEIAQAVVPGQFVMLRLPGSNDPLLGRPLAVYDVLADKADGAWGIDVVYLVVGQMTGRLAGLAAGSLLEAWGPLGNGFPPLPAEHLILVAGGIGQTPFLMLAEEALGRRRFGNPPRKTPLADRVTFCYGARSKDYLAGVEDFQRAGVDVRLATDDGSAGHHSLVTELIAPAVEQSGPAVRRIVCCGPEAMMEATAAEARRLGVPCQVSLETPMACGIGICFSCVARIRDASGNWDYRRTCVEGPVFDADDVVF
ncbi:MAG: dihydroorotate dehydrogenase electron transfer subunit [Pirellulales bacterium]|nr:dihydroorotate dehydrogenase electron transfer subunit [Pirellulales bacterium]